MIGNIVTSFYGSILALASAASVWMLKTAYDKHKIERKALAKIERDLIQDLRTLQDNYTFIKHWKDAAKANRPYSYSFGEYLCNDLQTFNLSDLDLIRDVVEVSYVLKRSSIDLANAYSGYTNTMMRVDSIEDLQRKDANMLMLNANIVEHLNQIDQNEEVIKNMIINTIARVRCAAKIRKHSLFGYLSLLFKDVYPRVDQKELERQKKMLLANLERVQP